MCAWNKSKSSDRFSGVALSTLRQFAVQTPPEFLFDRSRNNLERLQTFQVLLAAGALIEIRAAAFYIAQPARRESRGVLVESLALSCVSACGDGCAIEFGVARRAHPELDVVVINVGADICCRIFLLAKMLIARCA
jgi:hypothetical protein